MSASREELLFQLAMMKPAAERAEFLNRECSRDNAMRARIEALITADEQTEGALAQGSPVAQATTKLEERDVPDETAGQRIGRYKILEKVGEGGCGVVYVAEQTEPVRRRVALKVIKLGMDTKQVVARFEAERQALAMMDHPNIAKVFDAGTTETGRPFFIMELVRGIRITDYCDQEKMPTRERLELFIQICHAIQHAHQKGIIHRDIKPSNILVSLHDGMPVPKVIDFGIAKATEGRLTDATVYTQMHQFIGTPAYMSPEQAEMSALDVDTRSDIYSLGVLLYELLTGKTPFDANELMSQGIDAIRKTIREKDPVRPSTKLATLQGEELTTAARRRSVDRSKLLHQLKGDLDWIVMKCLEKDRKRRYETANGLAMELKRHLNNETVVARPPSSAYRFQKLVRRNKLAVAAAGAVVGTLLLGIIATTWQAVRATQAKQQAVAAQASEKIQRQQAEENERKAVTAQKAEAAQELLARQRAYASDMNVAMQALNDNKFGQALDLLNRQRPQPGQEDLRGWEWRYLWQQARSDALFTLCREPSDIDALAVSPDGRLVAVGAEGKGGLEVWDVGTRKRTFGFELQGMECSRVAFSPTEPLLAFSTETNTFLHAEHVRATLHVWSTATGRMEAEWPLNGACLGLAFSSDGRTLLTSTASVESHGRMTLWRVSDRTMLASYPVEQPALSAQASAFAATPNLHLAAYGSPEERIHVIDLRNGNELWNAQASQLRVTALAFSPDHKLLASAAGYLEKDIRLWDAASGKELGRLEGHSAFVTSLTFWPDGKRLASTSADQTIRIWDVASRNCVKVLRGSREGVYRLALLPDDKTLVSGGSEGTVSVWDSPETKARGAQFIVPDDVIAFCFAPDGRSLLTLNRSGYVIQWSGSDFARREPLLKVDDSTRGPDLHWLDAFSRDGRFLAVGSTNGLIKIWDVQRGVLSCSLTNSIGEFVPLDFVDGGQKLIAGSSGTLQEWDCTTASVIQSWSAGWDGASLSPDEALSAAVSDDSRRLVVRNLAGRKTLRLELGNLGSDRSTFSPDSSRLVISSFPSGHVRVRETSSWREIGEFHAALMDADAMSFSPDGKRLLTGGIGERALHLWDTKTWQKLFTLEGQGGNHVSAAFFPDGNTIAALDATGILQIWRAPSWAEIHAAEALDKTE